MKHPYTVTEDRIEGTVFTARWLRTLLFLCEIPMLFLDWVVFQNLKDWSSLPGVLKGVVVVLILVCLYGHAVPFLDRQKWFVMDEKGIAWHTRHKDLFLPWAAVGCVALHSPMNRNSFLMFTADRAYMPYGKLRLDTFTDSCLGVQFRPELVAFAQRHAVFAGPAGEGLTDEWAESIFGAVNGKGRPGGGVRPRKEIGRNKEVKMKSTWTLPEGYGQKYLIDLKDNKKQFWIVNGLSILIMLALAALFFQLLWYGFLELHFEGLPRQMLVMALGMIAYIPLHELVHGVCIRRFSGKKANYGFTLVYAYAGSECYFNKRDYLIIAAAPVVFWGVVFLLLLFLLPANWRWVPYVWELFNLSGAAGDFYVFHRLRKESDAILCQDTGVKMAVFDRQ